MKVCASAEGRKLEIITKIAAKGNGSLVKTKPILTSNLKISKGNFHMAESQGVLSNISQSSTMATAESQSVKRKLPNECDNSAKRKKVEKENVYNNLEDICSGKDLFRYGRNTFYEITT